MELDRNYLTWGQPSPMAVLLLGVAKSTSVGPRAHLPVESHPVKEMMARKAAITRSALCGFSGCHTSHGETNRGDRACGRPQKDALLHSNIQIRSAREER